MINYFYVFDENNIYTAPEERVEKRMEILKGSLSITLN